MAEVDAGALAPVIPVAPASTDAPTPESTADQVTETPEGEEKPEAKPERTFTQKEVNEIAAKRAAQAERHALKVARAEAERDLARQQLEELRRPATQTQPQGGEPQPKDFQDYESYMRALVRYELKQEQETAHKETRAQQEARAESQRAQALREKFASIEEKYPDFHDAISDDKLPFNGAILAYIEDSKVGGDVAYHLSQNRAEFTRIASLPPIQQVVALNALEAKLTAPPKPTNTSAPIRPNGGNSAGSKSMLDMSQEEFEKHRKARLARK